MENGLDQITIKQFKRTEQQNIDKKIENRFGQDRNERLVEHLLGYNFNNPKIFDKLDDDQNRAIVKYGLPVREFMFQNPGEYENILRNMAKENGVIITGKSDCGSFFDKEGVEGAYFIDDRKIGINIDRSSQDEYILSLQTLRHELMHALQHKFYPNMSIEEREYEAHISGWNLVLLRENIEDLPKLFWNSVSSSVDFWYQKISDELGYEVNPEWDSPEYFLRNIDGVNDTVIQNYKTKYQIDMEK